MRSSPGPPPQRLDPVDRPTARESNVRITSDETLAAACPHCLQSPLPIVVTDRAGRIAEIAPSCAQLLNVSERSAGRQIYTLPVFFDGHRERVYGALRNATEQPSEPFPAVLRPRERAPLRVRAHVRELSDGFLEWTIHPVP